MNKLFLEDSSYYKALGIFNNIIDFDGNNDYKIKDKDLQKYEMIISQLYVNPISNFLIIKAKRNAVKTLLLSDGIIEWTNCFQNPMNKKYNANLYHPILHDIFLCVGKEETKYFNFLGYKTMQYLPKRISPTMTPQKKINNKTFLITTANTAYYNKSEKENLIALLKKIIEELDSLFFKYIFRIFDEELMKELELDSNKNIKNGSFEECLKLVDCVITTPSSISILAMYHNKAVAHLIYRDSPIFIQAGWNIFFSVNIKKSLENMLSFDKNRINFQNFQVSNYIVDNSGIEDEVQKELQKQKEENIKKFINQNLYNMLNSSFNFNIEYFIRKIYLKFKTLKIMKILRGKIK